MNIFFEDKALEDLYLKGSTFDKKYFRLQKGVIKAYVKTVNYIRAARRIEDLYRITSLHYENKSGRLEGQEYVRINDKYRLRIQSCPDEKGIIVNIILIEISKHYE